MSMTTERARWAALADELGLEFRPGVRTLLASRVAQRVITQQGRDPAELEAVLGNELLMGLLDRVFLGLAEGTWEGHTFYLYRHSTKGTSGPSTHSVHLQLFFPDSLGLGLSIYRERFWSKVGKLFGAQDIQLGNPELDPLVMIKAAHEQRARRFLLDSGVQDALLALFRDSPGYEIGDDGIEHRTPGRFLKAEPVRAHMRAMLAAALALEGAPTS